MQLNIEKTESICGFRPEVEQIENFIVGMLIEKPIPLDRVPPSPKPPTELPPTDGGTVISPKKLGSREISYRLFGAARTARTAKDALIDILLEMAKRDREFFEKLSRTVPGKRRKHLARTREEVYPQRPDLAENAIEISPGWWFGVNIANREKQRILKRACEAIDIEYGKDLEITFPNT